MKHIALAALLLLSACATAPANTEAQAACAPAGFTRAELDALKASQWSIADDAARNAFARALTACLGSPDPSLRDGLAFEGLQYLLRNRQLSNETMLALADDLEARLVASEDQGFERPFAALVLSEVARADRIEAYLTPERRARLLDAAIRYLTDVHDYRGFDRREGWRHGVAHGSDLMLQLVLNPALGKPELISIRDAIASQIAPREHFYIYGESERLARPILYMAQRGLFSEDEWTTWFGEISGPGVLGSWDNAFASQAGLARRHNLNSFIAAIYLNAKIGDNAAFAPLLPGAEAALRAMP